MWREAALLFHCMDQKAKKPEEKFRLSLRKKDIWWTVGFAAAALLLFGIQVLINWRVEWPDAPLRIRKCRSQVSSRGFIFWLGCLIALVTVFASAMPMASSASAIQAFNSVYVTASTVGPMKMPKNPNAIKPPTTPEIMSSNGRSAPLRINTGRMN
jgi:hypothetical protein